MLSKSLIDVGSDSHLEEIDQINQILIGAKPVSSVYGSPQDRKQLAGYADRILAIQPDVRLEMAAAYARFGAFPELTRGPRVYSAGKDRTVGTYMGGKELLFGKESEKLLNFSDTKQPSLPKGIPLDFTFLRPQSENDLQWAALLREEEIRKQDWYSEHLYQSELKCADEIIKCEIYGVSGETDVTASDSKIQRHILRSRSPHEAACGIYVFAEKFQNRELHLRWTPRSKLYWLPPTTIRRFLDILVTNMGNNG
jgi:hypothetical protein